MSSTTLRLGAKSSCEPSDEDKDRRISKVGVLYEAGVVLLVPINSDKGLAVMMRDTV